MKNIFLLGIIFLALGCIQMGEEIEETNETVEVQPQPRPVPEPSFYIVSPDEGEVVEIQNDYGPVDIILSTSNLIIKPAGTLQNKKGEGHFMMSLDGEDPVAVFAKSYTFEGIQPGPHSVRVELVNNDGSPYTPSIVRTVNFFVEKVVSEYIPEEYTITIHDFSYEPETLTVNVGDRITWINAGNYPRSATYTGVFDTRVLAPGESATIVMETPGTFEYYSLTYMGMKGTLVVEETPS